MSESNEVYLGDGLYASFDGWSVNLRAPRENGDHWVGIEPEVWKNLLEFRRAAIAGLREEEDRVRNKE